MSGNDIAYDGGISLRICYVMPGTDMAYAPRCLLQYCPGTSATILLRACYAMSGTDLAYAAISAYALATRCPVLTSALSDVRY
eukprot:3935586-Rhodomonas_salina.1